MQIRRGLLVLRGNRNPSMKKASECLMRAIWQLLQLPALT
ncbi:hypothetical protein CSB95_7198 [Pseudomonas aeruginosa]|nr:hypothetical protein CSC29_3575 [Pseudomonas aeruginosa]AWE85265.1 hypothetical protein CSC29_5783 [Pseudomonas aeruginosa]PRW08115.1 hypothetical protein CSB95_2206 [Pseudomonas aeruginosa]PRW18531.1 hypothetical protein CSB95_7198 [Pseudomonas aeruginosa]